MALQTDRLSGTQTSAAFKAPCPYRTTANVSLSELSAQVGGTWPEGVASGTRIFVSEQSNPVENGIYLARSGPWIRARDFDGQNEVVQGTQCIVEPQNDGGSLYYVSSPNPIAVGRTPITFVVSRLGQTELIWRTDRFTGDGSTAIFALSSNPGNKHAVDLTVDGVGLGADVDFNIVGTTLTFVTTPPLGAQICVRYGGSPQSSWQTDSFTGDGTAVSFTLLDVPASVHAVDLVVDGLAPRVIEDYVIVGNILTFTEPPYDGAQIKVRYGISNAIAVNANNVFYSDAVDYSTGSVGYTIKQARSRTVYLTDLGFDDSGLDASATNNNLAMTAWIAHATANPGVTYTAKRSSIFRITGTNYVFPANMRLALQGAYFLWSGDLSGSAGNVFTWGAGLSGDALRLRLKDGSNWRRLVTIQGSTELGLLEVSAESAGGVYGNNFDCGLYAIGSDIDIGKVKLGNLFISAQFRGVVGGVAHTNVRIGDLDVNGYAKGPIFNNLTGLRLKGGWIRGQLAGSVSDPGFNSLLVGALRDADIGNFICENAGEHGVRMGGWGVGEQTNKGVRFHDITIKNTGQCGFKSFTGVDDAGSFQEDITLDNITVVNPRARSGAGGWNDVGFLLQQMKNSQASNLKCFVDAGNPYLGMFISQSDDFRVLGYQFRQSGGIPATNALMVSEGNGPTALFPATPRYAINAVSVLDMEANGHSGEAVFIDVPTADARDIHIRARGFGGTDVIRWSGAGSRAVQPCIFEAGGRGFSGTRFNVPGHANLITRNLHAAIA